MKTLKLASCMAENTEVFCRAVAEYIQRASKVPTQYVGGIPWEERERLFDLGEIEILWLCGLPYVHKADLAEDSMEILAVPVPSGGRYGGRPVYFSDVVVGTSSPFRSIVDLRGASWAYNEPRSHSGFNVVRSYLAELGESSGFFGAVYQSGAHTASLEMVLSRKVDWAAIDSTVLEWSGMQRAGLKDQIRVIDSLGPSPIPPWVVSKKVPLTLRMELRALLIGMERDSAAETILEHGRIARFVTAQDRDYDPIRRMAARAAEVFLPGE
jgi:phosphonate transport system substrate-binding protein